jgi:hypothetical protein
VIASHPNRNFGTSLKSQTTGPRTDGRDRNGATPSLRRQRKARPNTGANIVSIRLAAHFHSRGVDNESGIQATGTRDDGVTDFHGSVGVALELNGISTSVTNSPGDSRAQKQGIVRCVYNGVHRLIGDITLHQRHSAHGFLPNFDRRHFPWLPPAPPG